jgi:hypothetical protein
VNIFFICILVVSASWECISNLCDAKLRQKSETNVKLGLNNHRKEVYNLRYDAVFSGKYLPTLEETSYLNFSE